MGLRSSLAQILTAPVAAALDGAVRDLVEEILDAQPLARREELDALSGRLDGFRRDLAERRGDLDALRQAIEAFGAELEDDAFDDDDDVGAALAQLDVSRADLEKKLQRALGALSATEAQLVELRTRLDDVASRAEQAQQTATSARNTAESAADAADALG